MKFDELSTLCYSRTGYRAEKTPAQEVYCKVWNKLNDVETAVLAIAKEETEKLQRIGIASYWLSDNPVYLAAVTLQNEAVKTASWLCDVVLTGEENEA